MHAHAKRLSAAAADTAHRKVCRFLAAIMKSFRIETPRGIVPSNSLASLEYKRSNLNSKDPGRPGANHIQTEIARMSKMLC